MPWKSRWQVDVPQCSLPTYLFNSPTAQLPETPLIIDADKPEYALSHHTYRLWAKRFAAGLKKNGFQQGDRVLLFSGNTIFFPCVLLGAMMAGGVFTGANPSYVARELAYQLQDSGARFLIAAEATLDTTLEAVDSIGFPRERVFVFDSGYATFDGKGQAVKGVRHWSHLLASPAEGEKFAWQELSTPQELDRTAVLNYSSGTTGVPKGVEITHLSYISNCAQTIYVSELHHEWEVRRARAVNLCLLPMYHAYGQTVMCVSSIKQAIPVYVMQKFDFVKMLEAVQKYKVTHMTLVPPIVVALAKRPEVRRYDLSSVEGTTCGAAPLGREPSIEYEALWPNGQCNVKQGWGMTEITCSACGWDPNETSESASVGELNPNVEAMIVDEEGKEVPQGQRGEFWVRGPNVMKGYWNKPDATKATKTEDGWLMTGDVAYRDEHGKIFIVDRKKELIKVKGNQVAPAELEALLLDHPAIQDAAVIGAIINGEELPRAYVVLQEGQSASPQEIAQYMAKIVARHKRLVGGVVCVDAIPKNPSGKILRKELRERAKREVGDSEPARSRL